MSRIAYVNGTYRPHREASVHVEDRGYQFADGIYEVVLVCGGRLVDEEPHLDRMDRSLREMRIEPPMARAPLRLVLREVLRRNRLNDGLLYLQVTRGVARRDHPFPDAATPPALVVTAKRLALPDRETSEKGIGVITIPDIRWERCDIKTIALVPSVLGKQQAREAGAGEAWLVADDGTVTEGTSTNAWIVTGEGALVTRDTSQAILAGVTRARVLAIARMNGLAFEERPFTVEEAQSAREAFLTSATSFVKPVTRIDDRVIGNGRAGSFTLQLFDAYMDHARGVGT